MSRSKSQLRPSSILQTSAALPHSIHSFSASNNVHIQSVQNSCIKSFQELASPAQCYLTYLVPLSVLPLTPPIQPAVLSNLSIRIRDHHATSSLQSDSNVSIAVGLLISLPDPKDDFDLRHLLRYRISDSMIRYAATYVSRFFPITGLPTPPRTPFSGAEVLPPKSPFPYPSLERFICCLINTSGASVVTLFIALVFVNRAWGRWSYIAPQDSPPSQYQIFFICILLACKYHHDEVHRNSHWRPHLSGMFELKDINAMERHLLHEFKHDMTVTAEEIKAQVRGYLRTRPSVPPVSITTRPISPVLEPLLRKFPTDRETPPSISLQHFTPQILPLSHSRFMRDSSMSILPERSFRPQVEPTTAHPPSGFKLFRTTTRRNSPAFQIGEDILPSTSLPRRTSAYFSAVSSKAYVQPGSRNGNTLVFEDLRNFSEMLSSSATTSSPSSFSESKKGLRDFRASMHWIRRVSGSGRHHSIHQTALKRSSDQNAQNPKASMQMSMSS